MLSVRRTRVLAAGTLGVVSLGLAAALSRAPGSGQGLRAPASLGSFQARISGATSANLRGAVAVGNPDGDEVPGTFVITLGMGSEEGTVILTRRQGAWPDTGIYAISETPSPYGFSALVVPGSLARPHGLFRGERGTLTITNRTPDAVTGRFELRGRGFMAAQPQREDREIVVEGSFVGVAPLQGTALR